MTDTPGGITDQEMEERVRPLVNDILARFNQENISPAEAGLVILALVHRLLGVMEDNPEGRRHFVGMLINVVNNFLAGRVEEAASACPPAGE